MRVWFLLFVSVFFNLPVWAQSPSAAFAAPDVATALQQVFGRSAYTVTDKIKIQEGLPGNARPLSANGIGGDEGRVLLSFDLSGPRKIALLMEPVRARRDTAAPLVAIYHLSDQASAIVVPVRFPYVDVRMTVVVEAQDKLWGAQEQFIIKRASNSTEGVSHDPCDGTPRDKLPRFTGPALDNQAHIFYSNKTGEPRIALSVQHQMSWEPVLDTRHCTVAMPRAIQSAQFEYDGAVVADAVWGSGVAQASMMLSLPAARVGAPLALRWQDTRGQRYTYVGTVPQTSQSDLTPLHAASEKGDLEAVRRLLATGSAVNATLPNGWTALGYAVANHRVEVAELLLSQAADPNIRFQYGDTALMWAVSTRHGELVTTLLAHGANGAVRDTFGNTLFALAVHGTKSVGLKTPPRPDKLPVIQILIARGLIDRADTTLTALQVAAEQDDYAVINALIESGFDPAVNVGKTPLIIWAVNNGYTDLATTLLAKGAPVNVESEQCETPLLAAVSRNRNYRLERNRKAMVALLLKHGAKPLNKNQRGVDAFKAAEAIEVYQKDDILKLLTEATVERASTITPPVAPN